MAGKRGPGVWKVITDDGQRGNTIMPTSAPGSRRAKRVGLSDWYPEIAKHVADTPSCDRLGGWMITSARCARGKRSISRTAVAGCGVTTARHGHTISTV